MKTGILFDLDGTLLDSLQDLTDSVNYVMGEYGFPKRTLEEVRSFIGNGARKLIALSVPQGQEPIVDEALKMYQAYYATHSKIKTAPYKGILEALEILKEKCPVAIVSNKPDVAVKTLCEEFFPGVYGLGETPDCPRKPAPDMLYKAMKEIGADRCIYVGDSEVDVLTAQNAGAECLSVSWGFRDEAVLVEAGAEHLCRDPRQLAETLLEMI